jgi:hypothetical protein
MFQSLLAVIVFSEAELHEQIHDSMNSVGTLLQIPARSATPAGDLTASVS